MKKLLILGLTLTLVLSIGTMTSADVVFSPEVGALYTTAPGNPILMVGGVTIYPGQLPMFGFRIRTGYRLNGGKGIFLAVGGMFTYPAHEKVDVHVGGGMNISDSNVANVTMAFGGQAYAGATFRVSEKAGIFVDGGWVNTAQKFAGTYVGSNAFGVTAGIRFDMGRGE